MVAKVFGKYEVVEKIGAGGFGEVFKGLDAFLNRPVAIKTCPSGDEELRKRFFREAEIAANLQHPNIVTIYDFGHQDETPYLVQEYLDGEDLDHKIARCQPLELTTRLDYLLQIAAGLEYAHTRDVVHRDIKPSNIRILDDGQVRIMDFGIAKLLTAQTQLTRTGMALGTAAYLPPEQIRGETVDQRGDIFSFGVLAYELNTFERPFEGDSLSSMLYAIAHKEPRPVRSRAMDCPPHLITVIETCLAKEPAERYQSFAQVIAELQRLSAAHLVSDGVISSALSPTAMPAVTPTSPATGSTLITPPPVPPVPPASSPSSSTPVSSELPTRLMATPAAATEQRSTPSSRPASKATTTMLLALSAILLLAAGGLGAWWLERRFSANDGSATQTADSNASQTVEVEPNGAPTTDPLSTTPPLSPPVSETDAGASNTPPTAPAQQETASQVAPGAAPSSEPAAITRPPDEVPPPSAVASPRRERVAETSPPPQAPAPAPPRAASGPRPLIVDMPRGFELAQLGEGERVYTDRTFTYVGVPWNLRDLTSLRSSSSPGTPINLTVGRNVELFVGHDLRAKDKPSWLASFEDTGLAIRVDGSDDGPGVKFFEVFSRTFPAGRIELGANLPAAATEPASMYLIFVRPE